MRVGNIGWTSIACSVCTNPSASATPQDESLVSTKWMLKNKDPKQSFKKKTEKQGNWKEANQMPDILMTQLPNPCLSFLAWSTAATFSNEFIGQTPQLVINSSTKGQLNRWLVVCVGGFGFLILWKTGILPNWYIGTPRIPNLKPPMNQPLAQKLRWFSKAPNTGPFSTFFWLGWPRSWPWNTPTTLKTCFF